jgi:fatty-acyl-CoA synthase
VSVHAGTTVGGILSLTAARFPNKTALVFEGARYSYRQLDELSDRLANSLAGLGAKRGEKIALLSRNSPEWVIAHFAVAKTGATLVPINFLFVGREIAYVVNHSDAGILVLSEEFLALAESIRSELPRVTKYIAIGGEAPPWAISYGKIAQEGPQRTPQAEIGENDAYMVMYTSGTTGRPKGVVLSHRSRVHVALAGITDYGMTHEQITGLPLPLFHMGGLNTCLLSHVLSGATVVLMRKFDVPELLRNIERERISFLFLAPSPIYSMIESPELDRTDLSSLRWCMYGGAPMPREILRKLSERLPGVRLMQGYGSTEAGQLSFLGPEDHVRRPDSAGRAVALAQIRVVDREGHEVPRGDVGEIAVRGPNVMTEYYKAPEATAEAFRGGWFHTGDLARLDEDGFLTIVDRKDDMIISGSENIYPKEVEEVLYAHPAVQDAAVFGVPDDKWGESVCATIVLKPGANATADEIIEYCKGRLASYKKPRLVKFVDSMPRTSIGKIAKSELREPYWRGRGRGA